MAADKTQTSGAGKQKATMAAVAVVVLVILWQVIGMMGGGGQAPEPKTADKSGNGAAAQQQALAPQQAQLSTTRLSSSQQAELMALQQSTQQKYVYALSDLQILKINQEIAETNRAIAAAKLDTVTSQKKIVDLLAPPPPPTVIESQADYSHGLGTPTAATAVNMAQTPVSTNEPSSAASSQEVKGSEPGSQPGSQQASAATVTTTAPAPVIIASYVVISVSELLNKWSAVLGFQGKLYNVNVGDVLPIDGSTVASIDKYSVVLEKEGTKKKISLVPII